MSREPGGLFAKGDAAPILSQGGVLDYLAEPVSVVFCDETRDRRDSVKTLAGTRHDLASTYARSSSLGGLDFPPVG